MYKHDTVFICLIKRNKKEIYHDKNGNVIPEENIERWAKDAEKGIFHGIPGKLISRSNSEKHIQKPCE